jgi:mRNA-degrading endonuclease toxin of MazEF toxin-antitoxin module
LLEPTQLLIDVATVDGQQTGLVMNSTVKCEHLDTVDQRDIVRTIGSLSHALMQQLELCMKAALALP